MIDVYVAVIGFSYLLGYYRMINPWFSVVSVQESLLSNLYDAYKFQKMTMLLSTQYAQVSTHDSYGSFKGRMKARTVIW